MGDVAKCPKCDSILHTIGAAGAATSRFELSETIYYCEQGHLVRVEDMKSFVG